MRALQSVYVYYQVADADAPALAARVRAMQSALGAGELKRRPEAGDGRQTWMEVYDQVDAALMAALDEAVASARLVDLIAGPRHSEVFVELETMDAVPCA